MSSEKHNAAQFTFAAKRGFWFEMNQSLPSEYKDSPQALTEEYWKPTVERTKEMIYSKFNAIKEKWSQLSCDDILIAHTIVESNKLISEHEDVVLSLDKSADLILKGYIQHNPENNGYVVNTKWLKTDGSELIEK